MILGPVKAHQSLEPVAAKRDGGGFDFPCTRRDRRSTSGATERRPSLEQRIARYIRSDDVTLWPFQPRCASGGEEMGVSVFRAHTNTGDPDDPSRAVIELVVARALIPMMVRRKSPN